MPIRIADGLPAKQELLHEGIQVMEEQTAQRQDIRPLKILLLNLMPKKEEPMPRTWRNSTTNLIKSRTAIMTA